MREPHLLNSIMHRKAYWWLQAFLLINGVRLHQQPEEVLCLPNEPCERRLDVERTTETSTEPTTELTTESATDSIESTTNEKYSNEIVPENITVFPFPKVRSIVEDPEYDIEVVLVTEPEANAEPEPQPQSFVRKKVNPETGATEICECRIEQPSRPKVKPDTNYYIQVAKTTSKPVYEIQRISKPTKNSIQHGIIETVREIKTPAPKVTAFQRIPLINNYLLDEWQNHFRSEKHSEDGYDEFCIILRSLKSNQNMDELMSNLQRVINGSYEGKVFVSPREMSGLLTADGGQQHKRKITVHESNRIHHVLRKKTKLGKTIEVEYDPSKSDGLDESSLQRLQLLLAKRGLLDNGDNSNDEPIRIRMMGNEEDENGRFRVTSNLNRNELDESTLNQLQKALNENNQYREASTGKILIRGHENKKAGFKIIQGPSGDIFVEHDGSQPLISERKIIRNENQRSGKKIQINGHHHENSGFRIIGNMGRSDIGRVPEESVEENGAFHSDTHQKDTRRIRIREHEHKKSGFKISGSSSSGNQVSFAKLRTVNEVEPETSNSTEIATLNNTVQTAIEDFDEADIALNDPKCGFNGVRGRIVNGKPASKGQFPWLTYLRIFRKNTTFMCAASVITQRFLLTAAHCILQAGVPPSGIEALPGALNKTDGKPIKIHSFKIHPVYGEVAMEKHDIALLRLSSRIERITSRPICISTSEDNEIEKPATVAGWGFDKDRTVFPEAKRTTSLMFAKMKILPAPKCLADKNLRRVGFDRVTQICTLGDGTDTCYGDSGGPVMVDTNGKFTQIGVVSFGFSCAVPNLPAVSTRVLHYLPWIKHSLEKWSNDPNVHVFQ